MTLNSSSKPCPQREDRLWPLQFRYLDLTNRVLPRLAQERQFPVRTHQDFQRIILDNLFGCCWSDVLDHQQGGPYRQLREAQLKGAIAIAEAMIAQPDSYTHHLNQNSLRCRQQAQQAARVG